MNNMNIGEIKRRYGLPHYISKYLSRLSGKDDKKEYKFYERVLDRLCSSSHEYTRAKGCLNHIMGN